MLASADHASVKCEVRSINCKRGERLQFESVSGRLRGIFGASWSILERLGVSWRHLGGVLKACLGASVQRHGAVLKLLVDL